MPVRAPALLRDAGVRGVHALLAVLFVIGSALLVPATAAHADTVRNQQWQLGFLRARDAWKVSTGKGITVAVIDSGVDANHPDLKGQVLPGADFVDGTTDGRTDFVGHGTTVAALIAGHNDADGVVGLAYDAKILPVRVLDKDNRYESGDVVARAVMWAVDRGVQVINLSLGSAEAAGALSDAIQYAFQHDVVVVACDGNLSNKRGTLVWHPAREPGVLAVSGVTSQGRFWTGSLQGPATVLAAPAANITGANPGGDYWNVQGTSFASPIVAATAALVRARFPTMNAPNVVNRLTQTAWDFGVPGRDNEFGFGIVNPARALTATVPSVRKNPLLASTLVGGRAGRAPGGGPDEPGSPNGAGVPQALAPSIGSPWLPRSAFVVGGLSAILLALAVIAVVMSGGVRVRRGNRIMVLAPLAAANEMSLSSGSRVYRSKHRGPEPSRFGGGTTADSLPPEDVAPLAVPPAAEPPAAGERRGGSHRIKRDRRRFWTPTPKQPVEAFEPLLPVEDVGQLQPEAPAAAAPAPEVPSAEDVQAAESPETPQAVARGRASVPAPAPDAPDDAPDGTPESLASWLNAIQDMARQTADVGGPNVDTGFDEHVTLDFTEQANPAPTPDAASARFRRADADKPEPQDTSRSGNGKAAENSKDRFRHADPAKPAAAKAEPPATEHPAEDVALPEEFHAFFDDLPRLNDLSPDATAALADDLDDSSDIGDPETTATAMLKAILEGLKKDLAAAKERAAAEPEVSEPAAPELAKRRPSPRPRKPEATPAAETPAPQPAAETPAADTQQTAADEPAPVKSGWWTTATRRIAGTKDAHQPAATATEPAAAQDSTPPAAAERPTMKQPIDRAPQTPTEPDTAPGVDAAAAAAPPATAESEPVGASESEPPADPRAAPEPDTKRPRFNGLRAGLRRLRPKRATGEQLDAEPADDTTAQPADDTTAEAVADTSAGTAPAQGAVPTE